MTIGELIDRGNLRARTWTRKVSLMGFGKQPNHFYFRICLSTSKWWHRLGSRSFRDSHRTVAFSESMTLPQWCDTVNRSMISEQRKSSVFRYRNHYEDAVKTTLTIGMTCEMQSNG